MHKIYIKSVYICNYYSLMMENATNLFYDLVIAYSSIKISQGHQMGAPCAIKRGKHNVTTWGRLCN